MEDNRPANVRSRLSRWVFTLNNYTDDEVDNLVVNCEPASSYLVFGREVGNNGTPHLQGFVIFPTSKRFNAVKALVGERAFLARARGTNQQAADYAKKDGEYEEFGELPVEGQGHRTDWDDYIEWVRGLGRMPSQREIIQFNPSLWARYSGRCQQIAEAFVPSINLVGENTPRIGWQNAVAGRIAAVAGGANAHERIIDFIVDPLGNSGKSWLCGWAMTKYPDQTQILAVGKRDDLAYAIDETKTIFLVDIPRTQMQYCQYSVLEMLKNRVIFSPKYNSRNKVLSAVPYVAVFSNEAPDMNAMSQDRYRVINI